MSKRYYESYNFASLMVEGGGASTCGATSMQWCVCHLRMNQCDLAAACEVFCKLLCFFCLGVCLGKC